MKDKPDDICECGDFRRSHPNNGKCELCSWLGPLDCPEFQPNTLIDEIDRRTEPTNAVRREMSDNAVEMICTAIVAIVVFLAMFTEVFDKK